MTDHPTSGSRWEPPAGASPDPGLPEEPATGTLPPAVPDDAQTDAGTPDDPRRRNARRAEIAGVAAALLVGGAAGGYAVGHATGGDHGPPQGFTAGQQPPVTASGEPDGGGSGDDGSTEGQDT